MPPSCSARTATGSQRLAADEELSREHAEVARQPDGSLFIRDLGSRNGTWVNGERIDEHSLAPGDRIKVGATTFELVREVALSRLYDDELIRPWYEHAVTSLAGGAELFDVHGHTGFNDPDGFTFSAEQLVSTLAAAEARGVVMPMHEPDGYPPANDRVLAEAAASDGRLDRLLPARSDRDPIAEARALPRRGRARRQAAPAGGGVRHVRSGG